MLLIPTEIEIPLPRKPQRMTVYGRSYYTLYLCVLTVCKQLCNFFTVTQCKLMFLVLQYTTILTKVKIHKRNQ